jgi:hypothetical protein
MSKDRDITKLHAKELTDDEWVEETKRLILAANTRQTYMPAKHAKDLSEDEYEAELKTLTKPRRFH